MRNTKEIGYDQAIDLGLEPIHYRSDAFADLGKGSYPGRLDALVWTKRKPALLALITLDTGVKVSVIGFQNNRVDDEPYMGLRRLDPGQRVLVEVDIGVRGGVRPTVRSPAQASDAG